MKNMINRASGQENGPEDSPMGPRDYDPKYWIHAEDLTVKQFTGLLLERYPHDAIIGCCGMHGMFIHCTNDGSHVTVDSESLDDIETYAGKSPEHVISNGE